MTHAGDALASVEVPRASRISEIDFRRLIREQLAFSIRRVEELNSHEGVYSYRAFRKGESSSVVVRIVDADAIDIEARSDLLKSPHASNFVAHSFWTVNDPVTQHEVFMGTRPYYPDTLSSIQTGRSTKTGSWLRRWDARTRIVRDLLESLAELHESGQHFRGRVNESNIAINQKERTAFFVDWDEPSARELGTARPKELQGQDVIEFSQLAQRLLNNRVWDNRTEIGDPALRTDRVEWVLEYCSLLDPGEVPKARELLEALFEKGELLHAYSRPAVREAESEIAQGLESCLLNEKGDVDQALAIAGEQLRSAFRADPVTRITAIPNGAVSRMLARLTIDNLGSKLKGVSRYAKPKGKWHVFPIEKFDSDLDESQLNRVAQWWAKDGLDYTAEDVSAHQTAVAEVRNELLGRDQYIYTDDVAEILDVPGAPCIPTDVVALRRLGAILAVPDHGRWLYPMFQFDRRTGSVSDLIFRAQEIMASNEAWDMLGWWLGGRTSLHGESFAKVLHTLRGRALIEGALKSL